MTNWLISLVVLVLLWGQKTNTEARGDTEVICPPPANPSAKYFEKVQLSRPWCNNITLGYNISAGDCYNYCHVRFNGTVTLHTCPEGWEFDPDQEECIDQGYIFLYCPDSRCPRKDFTFPVFFRASSCQSYYECSNGDAIKLDCAKGTRWSNIGNGCYPPPTDCIDLPDPNDE